MGRSAKQDAWSRYGPGVLQERQPALLGNVHPGLTRPDMGEVRLFGTDVAAPPTTLESARVTVRPLEAGDYEAWSEVRRRNDERLRSIEPASAPGLPDPTESREAFE